MNRFMLVTTLFAIAACSTPSLTPNRSESRQAMESADDELLGSNDPVENFEGIEDIELPNAGETAARFPQLPIAEPEIICTREIPTGSLLSVEVCRRQSDVVRRQEADQKIFEGIKDRTAVGASRP